MSVFVFQIHQLPRALYSVGKHNSTPVDEEGKKAKFFPAMKTKARTVVGTGGKSPLCDPRSELRLGRENEKETACEDN